MKKKYIFLDYDQTLFSHHTFTMPESTYHALAAAKANGHHLILDTGRVYHTARPEHQELFDSILFSNGAGLIKNHAIVFAHFFAAADIARLIHIMIPAGAGLSLHGIDASWNDPIALAAWGIDPPDPVRLFFPADHMRRLDEYKGEPINKIDFFYTPNTDRKLAETALGKDWEIARIVSAAGAEALGGEVTLPGLTKGSGLIEYLQKEGIAQGDSIAVGDSANDIPMLRAAGIGVAMGNASVAVKKAADYVTSGIEEDGIYRAFEHLGLIGDMR